MRNRPALVVRTVEPANGIALLWVLMITSTENEAWEGDISLTVRFGECGLPAPSVIRTAKIATVECARASFLGSLPGDLMAAVRQEIDS